ncbi:MAG: nucleotidyltransferase [Candidatus Omnitrophica bacterium]|nr:nucleotidyltransferase [Candidatus Omnitrophota bacterium]
MSRLEHTLVEVAQFLEQHDVPYMVIGGIANVVWGIPRTTLDVDLTIWVTDDQLEAFVKVLVQAFPARVNDPIPFVKETRVLPLITTQGVQIDVIFGQLPYEEEAIRRAARERVQGIEIRVCQPEDLVLHKLVSERPKDREDVRGIIQQQTERLDRTYLDPKVSALARELGRPDIEAWYEQCWRGTRQGGPRGG